MIIFIEKFFEIFIYFLTNRSFFSIFAIRTMHCSKIQKRTNFEIAKIEILKIKQRLQILRQRRIQRKIIEIAKSILTFRDIDIFDSTFICNIQKFELYNQITSFLQHFEQCQHQYRKSNMFDLLFKCFRDFAFAWFKNQIFFIIQNFDRDLTYAFFIISFKFVSKTSNQLFITFVSYFSFQYHSCVECFVQFFSLNRFLKHIKQKNVCFKIVCKYCEQNFNFKNKFHDHIREYHVQKSTIICSFVSFVSFIFFCNIKIDIMIYIDIWINIIEMFEFFDCDT